MADNTEKKVVLTIDTEASIKSVSDLKEELKKAQQVFNGLGKEETGYAEAAQKVAQAQYNLKTAVDASKGATAQTIDVTKKANASYNELQQQLTALKGEWRNLTDATQRAELGQKINAINDQLKEMDATVGSFQRNVGNYKSALKDYADGFKNVGKGAMGLVPGVNKVGDAFEALSKNPVLAILGLIVGTFMRLKGKMQENKDALEGWNKMLAAGKKLLEPFNRLIEKLGDWLGRVFDKVAELMPAVQEFAGRAIPTFTGVGNAILQFVLTPIRTVIDAFKGLGKIAKDIFTGDWRAIGEDAKKTAQDIGENFKKGFSFKANFNAGQDAGINFVKGLGSRKVKKAAGDAVAEVSKSIEDKIKEEIDRLSALLGGSDFEKNLQASLNAQSKRLDEMFALDEKKAEYYANLMEEYRQSQLEAEDQAEQKYKAQLEARLEAQKASYEAYGGAVRDIMSAVADIMEASGDAGEKSNKKIKALRIAAATIDTIQGSVAAYMGAMEAYAALGVAAIPLAAAQAATVAAAGAANIAKLRASSTGSTSATAIPQFSAPTVSTPNINIGNGSESQTGGGQEYSVNQKDQRVVLVYSDVQAADTRVRTVASEASW